MNKRSLLHLSIFLSWQLCSSSELDEQPTSLDSQLTQAAQALKADIDKYFSWCQNNPHQINFLDLPEQTNNYPRPKAYCISQMLSSLWAASPTAKHQLFQATLTTWYFSPWVNNDHFIYTPDAREGASLPEAERDSPRILAAGALLDLLAQKARTNATTSIDTSIQLSNTELITFSRRTDGYIVGEITQSS